MLTLVIGDKAYSSWSLRPWLVLKQAGIPFAEKQLSFGSAEFKAEAARLSPSKRVPVLIDDGLTIWDSLAIVEYLADRFPEKELWPVDPAARAVARSMCAEMHSGFATLRGSLTMNFFARFPGRGWNVKVQREIDRIVEMWTDARARFGSAGPFLFGKFSIADAYFAPVAQRFYGYTIPLPPALQLHISANVITQIGPS